MAEKPPRQKQESAGHTVSTVRKKAAGRLMFAPSSYHTGPQPGNGTPTFRVGLLFQLHCDCSPQTIGGE